MLHPSLLHNLSAKAHDSCIDCNNLKYTLLYTSKPKRDGWVESVIGAWNDQMLSEDAKITLYPVGLEPKIVTFTKTPGDTMEDHFITKTIRAQQVVEGSSYEYWGCPPLSKELEIDMVDKGQVEGPRKRKQAVQHIEPVAPKRKYARREPLSQRAVEAAGVLLQFAAVAADPSPVVAEPVPPPVVANLCAVAPDASAAVSLELVDSRVISSLNTALAAKNETVAAKDGAITANEKTITAKDETITAKNETIAAKDSAIAAKDETIRVMASFMSRV
jgi:hypothetical protein